MSSIFLSHSNKDKSIAIKLARDLQKAKVKVWLDEAEMKIGDSLIEKIGAGIKQSEYLAVILTRNSVGSEWVQREVEIALTEEIHGHRVKVLPLLAEDCDIPAFLQGKLYGDLRTEALYQKTITQILDRVLQLNQVPPTSASNLFPLLVGALSRFDKVLFREAIREFIALPNGQGRAQATNVLGIVLKEGSSIDDGHSQLLDIIMEESLIALAKSDDSSLAAVEYLRNMGRGFEKPPLGAVKGVRSALLSDRLGANLCLLGFKLSGTSDEAEAVLLRREASLALRCASAYILGFVGHIDAEKALEKVAKDMGDAPYELQEAVLRSLEHFASIRAFPKEAFINLFDHSNQDWIRYRAAIALIQAARNWDLSVYKDAYKRNIVAALQRARKIKLDWEHK